VGSKAQYGRRAEKAAKNWYNNRSAEKFVYHHIVKLNFTKKSKNGKKKSKTKTKIKIKIIARHWYYDIIFNIFTVFRTLITFF
jgi:hypothetical protein